MTFSIIIPVYNVEPFLRECLDSVLTQTCQDYEIIIVNDGSSDNSMQVFDQWVAVNDLSSVSYRLISQTNQGLSAARNVGIAAATGDYLIFLDSDDVLGKDALEVLKERIDQINPDVLAFNAELWYSEENIYEQHYFNRKVDAVHSSGIEYLCSFVRQHHYGPAAACFYCIRRSVLIDNDLWFEKGLICEDALFVPQMLVRAKGNVVEIAQTLYFYRMRHGSICHVGSLKKAKDLWYIARYHDVFMKTNNLPRDLRRDVVYNNAMLSLRNYGWVRIRPPFSAVWLVWKNASLSRKWKLLRWIHKYYWHLKVEH